MKLATKIAGATLVCVAPIIGRSDLLVHPAVTLAVALLAATWLTQPDDHVRTTARLSGEKLSLVLITLGSVGAIVAGLIELRLKANSSVATSVATSLASLLAGFALAAAGFVCRLWAIRTLGRFFTSSLDVARDQRVVETGPYRFVRHPAFFGVLLSGIGLAAALQSIAALATCLLVLLPAYLFRIRREEDRLVASLGKPYQAYQARTAMLIPFVL